MIRLKHALLAALTLTAPTLAISLAGCATAEHTATEVQATAQAATNPTLSVADAAFMDRATRAGIAEVTFGQLARDQGARASVRDFGLRLVTDYTTLNQRLNQLSVAKKITPPNEVQPTGQQAYATLQALQGKAFDRAFVDNRATALATLLQVFQAEASGGADADVRAFAAGAAPGIQQHLTLIERLGGRPQPSTTT